MSGTPENIDARGQANLRARVAELEKAMRALMAFVTELEEDQDVKYMPKGDYCGSKFE